VGAAVDAFPLFFFFFASRGLFFLFLGSRSESFDPGIFFPLPILGGVFFF